MTKWSRRRASAAMWAGSSSRSRAAASSSTRSPAAARVELLVAERRRLDDPAYIAAEARRRLHFVMPGETAYVVIPPEPAAEEAPGGDAPWYAQLWDSVAEADRPSPASSAP